MSILLIFVLGITVWTLVAIVIAFGLGGVIAMAERAEGETVEQHADRAIGIVSDQDELWARRAAR